MKYCTHCGAKLSDKVRFCTSCGTKQDDVETPVKAPNKVEEEVKETLSPFADVMLEDEGLKDESPFLFPEEEKVSESVLKPMKEEVKTTLDDEWVFDGDFGSFDTVLEEPKEVAEEITEEVTEEVTEEITEEATAEIIEDLFSDDNTAKPSGEETLIPENQSEFVETVEEVDLAAEAAKKARAEAAALEAKKKAEDRKLENRAQIVLSSNSHDKANYPLWSWLKRNSSRKYYFTEEVNETSTKEFAIKVQKKLIENGVPAELGQRVIEWDNCGILKHEVIVKPTSKTEANPYTYLLQFNHVGKYSFVEEKTFITPPDLPETCCRSRFY